MADTKTITFAGFEIKDEAKGEVAAKIATLEVVDKDGDIVRRGSLPKASKAVMSRWGHDAMFGERPVGKGTIVEKDGRLEFSGKMFMKTAEGRETFETLKEMGSDQEWSFGFRVAGWENPSPEEKKSGAWRIITKMEPVSSSQFEVSPVLAGAGMGTGTTSVKSEKPAEPPPVELDEETKAIVAEVLKLRAERAAAESKTVADAAAEAEAKAADLKAQTEAADLETKRQAETAVLTPIFERFQKNMRKFNA